MTIKTKTHYVISWTVSYVNGPRVESVTRPTLEQAIVFSKQREGARVERVTVETEQLI